MIFTLSFRPEPERQRDLHFVIPTGAGAPARSSLCHSDRSRSASDGGVEEPAACLRHHRFIILSPQAPPPPKAQREEPVLFCRSPERSRAGSRRDPCTCLRDDEPMGRDVGGRPNQQAPEGTRSSRSGQAQERDRAAGGPCPTVEPPHLSRKQSRASHPPGSMSVMGIFRQSSQQVFDFYREAIRESRRATQQQCAEALDSPRR